MDEGQLLFDQRLQRIGQKHRALSRGYLPRMRSDGLIVLKPKRMRPSISGRSVVLFLGSFLIFKGFLIANLGEQTYQDRVSQLGEGTVVEQAGAFLMQADPLAQLVSQKIGPILR